MKKLYTVLLALVLGAAVLVGFWSLVDVDATESVRENRRLAERPKFTLSALLDGSYVSELETYYSDTFPLREDFMALSDKVTAFLTRFGGKDDNVIVNYDKHDSDFVGEGVELTTEEGQTTEKSDETK